MVHVVIGPREICWNTSTSTTGTRIVGIFLAHHLQFSFETCNYFSLAASKHTVGYQEIDFHDRSELLTSSRWSGSEVQLRTIIHDCRNTRSRNFSSISSSFIISVHSLGLACLSIFFSFFFFFGSVVWISGNWLGKEHYFLRFLPEYFSLRFVFFPMDSCDRKPSWRNALFGAPFRGMSTCFGLLDSMKWELLIRCTACCIFSGNSATHLRD